MSTILQNDVTMARERATALANSVATLSSAGTPTKDSQTTIAGNTSAHTVIDQSKSIASQIVEVMTAMSSNINSVSSHFQAMDQQLGQELKSLNAARSFSLNG